MNLIEMSEKENPSESTGEAPQPESAPEEYERKFSLIQRFYKLFTAPSEAMKDIALAPEYGGVAAVIFVELVLASISFALAFQKIQIIGPYAKTISGMVGGVLAISVLIASGMLAARWALKSLLVNKICDSGSEWEFRTAASVTGYAYIADITVSILGIFVMWFSTPTFTIDTSNLEAARQALASYQAQTGWLQLVYTIPVSVGGLLWKSYLGGLGAHFGTEGECSIGKGFAVFFVLGLIGLLISFLLSMIY